MPYSPDDAAQLSRYVGPTFPNASGPCPWIIPWGDDASGLMVDHDRGWRVGAYADLYTDAEAAYLLAGLTVGEAVQLVNDLTGGDECEMPVPPSGWLRWATRVMAGMDAD
jgi:hypothetical protein